MFTVKWSRKWIARRRLPWKAAEFLTKAANSGPQDRAALAAWLRQSPRHVKAYLLTWAIDRELTEFLWRESQRGGALQEQSAHQGVSRAPAATVMRAVHHATRSKAARYTLIGLAASLAIVQAVQLARQWTLPTYETRRGESRVIRLDDGSTIHMNSGSRLRVQFLDGVRGVELLQGEALFTVAHDSTRPFRVRTRDVVTEAVGTEFDVLSSQHNVTVTVTDGRVAVVTGDKEALGALVPRESAWAALARRAPTQELARVQVTRGEELSIMRGGRAAQTDVHAVDPEELRARLAWRSVRLFFEGETVTEAVARFNQHNTAQIVVDDPKIAGMRISGVFPAGEPENFVAVLNGMDTFVTGPEKAPVAHLARIAIPRQPESRKPLGDPAGVAPARGHR